MRSAADMSPGESVLEIRHPMVMIVFLPAEPPGVLLKPAGD
jgi:hypothetical protein